ILHGIGSRGKSGQNSEERQSGKDSRQQSGQGFSPGNDGVIRVGWVFFACQLRQAKPECGLRTMAKVSAPMGCGEFSRTLQTISLVGNGGRCAGSSGIRLPASKTLRNMGIVGTLRM